METRNRVYKNSLSPFGSSCNTDPEKDYFNRIDRQYSDSKSHKRINSNDLCDFKLDCISPIGNFCGNCVRLERQIQELKKKTQRENEKNDVREKHMRQLDSLLQIKDKRLKEEDLTLKNDKSRLESEVISLKKLVKEIHNEKNSIENEKKLLAKENSALSLNLTKSERKCAELQRSIKKQEEDKLNQEESIKSKVLKTFEARENNLKQKELEISSEYEKINYENELIEEKRFKLGYYEQNLMVQEKSLNLKLEELSNYGAELEESRSQLKIDQNDFENRLENHLSAIKSAEAQVSSQEKSLKSKFHLLDMELENVESLKAKLQEQSFLLNQEISNYKSIEEDLIKDSAIRSDNEAEESSIFQEKEQYIEEMIRRLNEEEKIFSERWSNFKKTEDRLKNEVEYFKRKSEELEQKLMEPDAVINISPPDYQEKEEFLKAKEEELLVLEESLKREREDVDSTAELVQSLNKELILQKRVQDQEHEKIEKEKQRLVELLTQQEERARALALREQELAEIREDLMLKRKEGVKEHISDLSQVLKANKLSSDSSILGTSDD